MKHITSIILTALATCALVSCTDDLVVEDQPYLYLDESDIMETQLGVSVNGFSVSVDGTRADTDPDNEVPTEDKEIMTDFEKTVDNIWVFQYDATTKELLIKPRYYLAKESETEGTWRVLLKPVESTIYVVTNVNSDTWASDYTKFATIEDGLLKQTLPFPSCIMDMSETSEQGHIPMKGCVGEVTPVSGGNVIVVPVEHMYAKVKMRVILDENLKQYESVKVSYISYGNIPYYCQVGTLYTQTKGSKDENYPNNSNTWISRATEEPNNTDDPNNEPLLEAGDSIYDYVIYLPENIQGETENTEDAGKATDENTPEHAFNITVEIGYIDDENVQQTANYTAYPGGNDYNNYNIRRNQVYRVTMRLGYPVEVIRTPSANCLFGYAGETIAFYPYYRVETGGGYNFTDYLSPNTESGNGSKIAGLKIIWQTKDCIGDNTNGDLVYLVSSSGVDITGNNSVEHDGYEQICVKTQKEGNALIGAYDEQGNIIWSWHIWVRDKQYSDPTNLANAMVYYTYDWDKDRVYSYQYYTDTIKTTPVRVPGYQIMSCNIGALQDTPNDTAWADAVRTFGMLYQWGRKDPFPPVIKYTFNPDEYDNEHAGIHYGNDNVTSVGKDSINVDSLFHTHIPQSTEGMAYTIKNPTVFMCGMTSIGGYSANHDYSLEESYTMGGAWSEEDHDNKEWGGLEPDATTMKRLGFGFDNSWDNPIEVYDNYGTDKSIFDPCPYGWRVPPADLWMGFLRNGINDFYDPLIDEGSRDEYSSMDNVNYDPTRSNEYGLSMYLGSQWRSGEVSYFPCQGFRFGNGQVYRVGTCGCYANANVRLEDNLNCLHLHNDASYTKAIEINAAYTVKSSAGSIRCVRDTK